MTEEIREFFSSFFEKLFNSEKSEQPSKKGLGDYITRKGVNNHVVKEVRLLILQEKTEDLRKIDESLEEYISSLDSINSNQFKIIKDLRNEIKQYFSEKFSEELDNLLEGYDEWNQGSKKE